MPVALFPGGQELSIVSFELVRASEEQRLLRTPDREAPPEDPDLV